jgi:signal transduction histidine kinase
VILVRGELRRTLDSALQTRAQQVAELAVSAPAVLTQPGALETPVSGRQIAVEVIDSKGRIIARSLTLGARLLPRDAVARAALAEGRTGFEDITIDGRPFRLFAAPIAQAGGPAAGGAVLVASDTSDIGNTLGHLTVVLILSGVVAALLAVLAAAVLTRRGLRPLRRLAVAAGEIERTADPARRLPDLDPAHPPDEIGQLTGVLNRMLESLAAARAAERRFLADASHELRTPVTSLRGNVEYAARHGVDAEVLDDLQRDAARLARLVDDLLVLERATVSAPEAGPVSLDEVVEAVVDGRERVRVEPHEPIVVLADEEALRRAVENLVDNGLIHGPPEGVVTVRVAAADAVARLTVSDEGPGPGPEDREHLFERFWRSPEAAERPGSGLGLSIVAATVERYGGRVTVDGSAFTVELPVAGPR